MEIVLDKKEILRYLGYRSKQELTTEMDVQILQLMEEIKHVAVPRYTFLIFPCRSNETEKSIQVVGTDLILEGKAIYNHLKNANKVALLAATLGIEVERQIRKYELTEMSKALILDACCVEYIEKICGTEQLTTHPVFHYQTPHTMTDILTEIIACKQIEIELQKAAISKEMLINNCNEPMPRISMRASLASSPYGIISEFKRRSPSKGWIKEDAQADTIPPAYEAAGASALSILTDEKYFGGSLKDIRSARPHVQLPILRKDFIIDEYQLYQARIVGADAILLIAAALKKEQCKALALKAHELELEVLLEIHNEQELEYIDDNIDMVGVNNRNLGSFHTEVENSFRLAEKLPEEMLRISESGISSPETVKQLRAAGFRGFLIGENFMKTPAPGEALKKFITQLEKC